jgi:NAD(P)H-hydrate epimerase
MEFLINSKQSRELEERAINGAGLPSAVLMERAAVAVVDAVYRRLKDRRFAKILVLCGPGNNGADGIAVSRILSDGRRLEEFYDIKTVIFTKDGNMSQGLQFELNIFKNKNYKFEEYSFDEIPEKYTNKFFYGDFDIVIDAVFGTGLSRNVEGNLAKAFDSISSSSVYKISVDIPSGVNSDTGEVMGAGIYANETVTMSYRKLGLVLPQGTAFAGNVTVARIGMENDYYAIKENCPCRMSIDGDFRFEPKRRFELTNKWSNGNVLIIGGSEKIIGAPYLSALAAYRAGAGLVKIFTSEAIAEPLMGLLPEALFAFYDDDTDEKDLDDETLAHLYKELGWANVVVVGPGLGLSGRSKAIVREVLNVSDVPVVVDADALNLLEQAGNVFKPNFIFTPHMLEMGRLIKTRPIEIAKDMVKTVRDYVIEHNIVLVLKGPRTIIARKVPDKESVDMVICDAGTAALSKAGTGDTLTGIIAALVGLGQSTFDAAVAGVYLHGMAGRIASENMDESGPLAREIANAVPVAMKNWHDKD